MNERSATAASVTRLAVALAMGGWLAPEVALAQDATYALTAGARYSDNIERSTVGEISDTAIVAGLQLGINREGSKLAASIGAGLEYLNYLDNDFRDEVVGSLNANLTFALVPDRFQWVVQDMFGQTRIDRSFAESPSNRQYSNVFTTGPDWRIPLGERSQLRLEARWSDVRYETTEADNQRYSGTVTLSRAMSPASNAYVGVRGERIEYEPDSTGVAFEYDVASGYLGYRHEAARTTIDVQAGYTSFDGLARSVDGPLLQLAIDRELTPRSTLEFRAGTALTDSAQVFRRDQELAGVDGGTGTVVISRDPLQSSYASLAVSLVSSRNTIRIGLDWRRDDQETELELDRGLWSASLVLSREMSSRLRGRVSAGYLTEDAANATANFDEWFVGAGLEWTLTRTLSLALRVDRYEGSYTDAAPGSRNYAENRAFVGLTYAPRR